MEAKEISRSTMEREITVHLLLNTERGSPIATTSSNSITPMLALTAFVIVLASFSFGFVVGYSSPVQSAIMKDLGLSIADYSLFGSMTNIGGAMGALVCGKMTDYLGRRRALALADVFYTVGWFSIVIAQGAWLLDVGRWMLGFALCITSYAGPIYIAEFAPKNLRGGFVLLHLLMLNIGASTVFLIGLIISWRTLALIGIIPSLAQIIGLLFIPESPRWLLMVGRDEEFRAALHHLRGANANISQEATDIKESAEALQQMSTVSIHQLFQKKYAYALTVGVGLTVASCLVGLNGIISYARSIFESAGISGTVGTVALALVQLPGVVLGVSLMDKCGRRPLLMISATGLCIGCLLAGASFVLQDYHLLEGFSPYFALIGLLTYFVAYPAFGGGTAVIASEIFPLNIKGLAGSVVSFASWVFGWIVAYAFNFSMDWSPSGTFFIFGGVSAFAIVFVAKLVPETKGRTLEEIHGSISHIWQ